MQLHLLQAALSFRDFKPALYAYATAFVITLLLIPFVIRFVNRYKIYDHPGERKIHISSIPTMGGIAIFAGLIITMLIWVNIARYEAAAAFFLSVCVILGIGILDDLKNLPARYKISIETALAVIIALSGIRITEMNGLFGLHHLPLAGQYLLTVVSIVGVINAFNLIDGIDGLAGGLGFMSLITLGIFLFFSKEFNYGLIAFAMAGAVLGFLYYNFNPAKIFMGDTGSLILGFVIAVLCIQLIRINSATPHPVVPHIRIFTLGIVFIPVFDSVRMFTMRLWYGRSPFSADKNHIHHLLTQNGFSHGFTTGALLVVNAVLLLFLYWLKKLNPEIMLGILILYMLGVLYLFRKSYLLKKLFPGNLVKKTIPEQQEKAEFKSR